MARFFSTYPKKKTLLLLTSACLMHAPLFSDEDTVNINRFTLRHIESKGIGYNQGYTTFEAFFLPLEPLRGRWVPFVDGRAHIFNNAKPAANVGAGLRYLNSRIWGTSLYYDFRKTSKLNYSQVSCGFETIGEKIDARINGYFPVGKHTSTRGSTTFDYFKGNHMYLAKREEFALQGVNAELGIHLGRSKKIAFYTAFGPYYFCNNSKQAVGGSARIFMDIRDVFKIETNTSYDNLFGWIGQGQVSLSYAFKPKKFDRLRGNKKSSPSSFDIRSRLLQKVDKFEIIVVDHKIHTTKAINPTTGQPYFFLFLDPNSPENGIGTFESPFNSLAGIENLVPLEPMPVDKSLPVTTSFPLLLTQSTPEVTAQDNVSITPQLEKSILANNQTPNTPSIENSTHRLEGEPLRPEIIILSPTEKVSIANNQSQILVHTPTTHSAVSNVPLLTLPTKEMTLVPGKGQELQTTLGTVMVPSSQKGHPKITHVKDIEYQGKKTHVFVITMEEDPDTE